MKLLILLLLSIGILGCGNNEVFSEKKWSEQIEEQKVGELHEENYDKENNRYKNPWMKPENKRKKSFGSYLWTKFTEDKDKYPIKDDEYLPKVLDINFEKLNKIDNYILWIGHMTYFIKLNSQYYLLDPVFSDRALVPKRITKVPIGLEELLEKTKANTENLTVLITHNHYDHLDIKTIEKLTENTKILLPKGDKKIIEKIKKFNIKEVNWYDEISPTTLKNISNLSTNETKITFVPAQHWSNRVFKDRNSSLWGSFILESINPKTNKKTTMYLGGDSGYFIGFKELGEKYNIDYALMSVGANEPRWFMHESHLNIAESIKATNDMKAKVMIPGHWGTFKLGGNPAGLPKYQYEQIDDKRVRIMDVGEFLEIK